MATRVLLVEDEADLLRALDVRLSASGFTCDTAQNGKEALAKIQQRRPALIIADLLMPEMDGYALVRQLKADPRTADIPIIVLTAVPEFSRASRAEELKGAHLMNKPYDAGELLATVRAMVATIGSAGGTPDG